MITPTLTDGTIVLDGFLAADIDAHLAGEDEEQARRFGWFPARSTRVAVASAIARWQEDWRDDRPRRAFAVRAGGILVGGCEVRMKADGSCEMSYWVFPEFRGRGLGTRALALLMSWAAHSFTPTIFRLEIEPDNRGSIALARHLKFVLVREQISDQTGRAVLVFERSAN
jgi:RimJ/RimL family protein N-acetyltransferase